MKRPLCCVCAAFVATVFLFLKFGPLSYMVDIPEEGKRVTLLGEISQKEYKEGTLILCLKQVSQLNSNEKNNQKENRCGVQCYIEADEHRTEPRLGSRIAVEGKVSYFREARNPGEFDARSYYRIIGTDYRLYDAKVLWESSDYSVYQEILYEIKCFFEGIYDQVLPAKTASVMKAMVLGNKAGLDEDSKQLFQRSGIAHVFAISGLHITLLGMGLYKLLRKMQLSRLISLCLPICMMIAYGDMVGMSSSAYRAVFMFIMRMLSRVVGRTYDVLTSLAMAAVMILIEQPLYLYHTGFLLSFGAILGVGCLSEVIRVDRIDEMKRSMKLRLAHKIKSALCGSLCIFLVQFPIMLCAYYEFPVYSFLLNLIIIPAMTLVMTAGILCLVFGSLPFMAGLGAAKIAGLVCQFLLSGFEWLCTASLKLPFADWIVGRPDGWRICVYFALILLLYGTNRYVRNLSKRSASGKAGADKGLPFGLKAVIIVSAVLFVSNAPVDGAAITFLDVGQGECIWVESAKGEHFLIDGGSTSQEKVGTYTIVPYLKYMGVSRLDAVFLTHLDRDHISGVMEMLEEDTGIVIGRVCISDAVPEDEAYERLTELCLAREVPVYRLKAGDSVRAYQMEFEVLHPADGYQAASHNACSLVMKLSIKDSKDGDSFVALLTGDVEADGEYAAAEELAKCREKAGIDLYKAAHHGSRSSNTEELINEAKPHFAVISCGEDNSYGHPHMEALQNFRNAGSEIFMTKDTGAIMIHIKDGEHTIDTWR